ncbi:ankyrin repeat-containing domain protein [Rhizophagus irregularis DAOM 181602=DAOM 197198]|nr:ankyrin repeat-containing domain protein [Rhizophagus irregularis DAOM 181602=DAOM 197198]
MIDLSRRSPSYEMRLATYTERGLRSKYDAARVTRLIYSKNFAQTYMFYQVDLCSSYARGDVNIAESILKSNSLPNVDEDFQIERYNARIIARISDDKENDQDDIIDVNTETCDHLLTDLDYATIFGHVEIKSGLEIASILLKNGASAFQVDQTTELLVKYGARPSIYSLEDVQIY